MSINSQQWECLLGVKMAIYFLAEGGSIEGSNYYCLFCHASFGDRSALNVHYFQEHSGAFSAEELVMAAARRAHGVAHHGNSDAGLAG
jgi:hypothetical protein